MKRLTFLVAAVLSLAAPSASSAFTIGQGFGPGVALDDAGTAYIAWSGPENPASLQYCRLPRNATACDIRTAIAAAGTTSNRAFVASAGLIVSVVQYRSPLAGPEPAGMYEFTSFNGGATFDAGRRVGTIPFFEAVTGPGLSLWGVTDANSGGGLFQASPLDDGSPVATGSAQLFGLDHPYRGTVGRIDNSTPLAVFTTGGDEAQFRRYAGSGDLNDAATWAPAQDLGVAAYPKLATGRGGLFLLASAADKSVFARKWNGTTFGPPVTVAAGADAPTLHAGQDGAGRVHAVFARGSAAGLNLIYARSDEGTTWSTSTVTTQSPPVGIAETRVAMDPSIRSNTGTGVVVYRAGNPTGEIRVEAVPPIAPPAATLPPKNNPPAKAQRGPGGKVEVTIKGALGLPAGVDPALACPGKLGATVKRGSKPVAKRALKLSSACKYGSKLTLKPSKVKRAKHLELTLSFPGNASLGPVRANYKLAIRAL